MVRWAKENKIALGFNVPENDPNLTPLYVWFHASPQDGRVGLGSVERKTLGGLLRTDGERVVEWRWQILRFSELNAYVMAVFTSWEVQNVEVTIRTQDVDGVYRLFNAVAHLPRVGQDWEDALEFKIRNVRLRFTLKD